MDKLSVEEIVSIFLSFKENRITDEQRLKLDEWLESSDENRAIFDQIFHSRDFDESLQQHLLTKLSILDKIKDRLARAERYPAAEPAPANVTHLKKWVLAAASVVLLLGTGAIFWKLNHSKSLNSATTLVASAKQEIQPGGNKALLHLSNGQTIVLDSAVIGKISTEGTSNVRKSDKASLSYTTAKAPGKDADLPVVFNSVETPRGGFYNVILTDGTKVWLNSSSSLRFPTAFRGPDRVVTLTGEGYFEVARDKQHPFKVLIGNNAESKGSVEVLGTHFNVNAYDDEASVKTTLLEGSVRYRYQSKQMLLSPGEQAQLSAGQDLHLKKDINAASALAWKDGFFEFQETDILEVLKQMSRWYAIDVVYGEDVSKVRLSGRLNRNVKFADVVRMLEISGVKCQVEGNKITVSK